MVEPQGAGRAAPAPFADERPFAKQCRRDVDDAEAVDVSGRVGAGQESHCLSRSGRFETIIVSWRWWFAVLGEQVVRRNNVIIIVDKIFLILATHMAATRPTFIIGYYITLAGIVETEISSDEIFFFTDMAKYCISSLNQGCCSDFFARYVVILDTGIVTAGETDIAPEFLREPEQT